MEGQSETALRRAGGAPFFDRTEELDALLAARAAAADGRGSVVLLAGEAGIGKTALARRFLDHAMSADALVAWGAGWDAGGAPAYWPWIQALRGLTERLGVEAVSGALPGGPGLISRLLPELGRGGQEQELGSEEARFALFDSVVRLLRTLGGSHRPLVLVLDDLHAADADALLMLELVARSIPDAPVLVLGTLREDAATPDEARAALARVQAGAHTIRLGGLRRTDVAAIVSSAGGGQDDPLVQRLHDLTDGNPLFLNESLRLLDSEGAVSDVHLPRGLRETIRRRIAGLPDDVRALLDLAAAIGREFRLETLAAADGRPAEVLLPMLDAAVVHAVLRPVRRRPGRYRFAHGLLREAIHEALPARRRAEIHRDVALAIERVDGDRAESAELAHHWLEAAAAGEAERAVEAAAVAGTEALRRLAWDQADAWFADALATLELLPGDDTIRCALLLSRGDAQMRAGRVAGARATLTEAAELASVAGDPDTEARAALACVPWGLALTVGDDALEALLTRALAASPRSGVIRARLLAALANVRYWSTPREERLEMVEEAIALARAADDPRALARVLADAHLATWDPDSVEQHAEWLAELDALGTDAIGPQVALHAATIRIAMLLERGDLGAAREATDEFATQARALHQPRARRAALRHDVLWAVLEGRTEDAEAALARVGEVDEAREGSTDALLVAAQVFVLRQAQGRLGELEPVIRGLADNVSALPVWRCALVAALAQAGRRDDVRREVARLRRAGIPRDNQYFVSLALLVDGIELLGDAAVAREVAGLLAPYAGRWVVTADAAVFGPVDLFRGRALAVAGEADAAAEVLRSARDAAVAAGAGPLVALLDGETPAPEPVPEPLATPAPAAAGRLLRREGDVWRVTFGGAPFSVRDVRGLHHLARLLAAPEVEVHALDLVGGEGGRGGDVAAATSAGLEVRAAGDDSLGPALDETAKAAYRERLRDLEEELEEAEDFNDDERAARLRGERDALVAELAAAVGLGGRDRKTGSSAERARVNVTRAIRSAIDRLAEHDPALGRHLEGTVRTGTFCAYRPEPGAPEWEVQT